MTRRVAFFIAIALAVVLGGGVAIFGRRKLALDAPRLNAPNPAAATLSRADAPRAPAAPARMAPVSMAEALDGMFAAAPAPAWKSMRRTVFLEMNGKPMGEHVYTLEDAAGWRATVRDSSDVDPQRAGSPLPTPPSATDAQVQGAMDLFAESQAYSRTTAAGSMRERTILRLAALNGVEGRLFPLAVGNRLAFAAESRGAMQAAGENRATTRAERYEFRVTGRAEGFTEAQPAVAGPVYAIEVKVTTPDGIGDRHLEVHYAPSLGAAVRVRDLATAPFTEERLTSWEPAS